MAIDNSSVRWVLIGLVVLLLIPLIATLGMMVVGAVSGGGMMSHMGGMMGGGSMMGNSMMGGSGMLLGIVWVGLVAAALILLIVMLARGSEPPANRNKAA